ncbi:hypothetical protein [Actinomadura hibisca]|uniref:hypothetical protein n=1 Tax=Actinomadura hibisca TaxID=68565 RepID=UPI0008336FFF|nr:hypothetical protein [Actinomadura hibisca]
MGQLRLELGQQTPTVFARLVLYHAPAGGPALLVGTAGRSITVFDPLADGDLPGFRWGQWGAPIALAPTPQTAAVIVVADLAADRLARPTGAGGH